MSKAVEHLEVCNIRMLHHEVAQHVMYVRTYVTSSRAESCSLCESSLLLQKSSTIDIEIAALTAVPILKSMSS